MAAFGATLLGLVGLTLVSARYLWRLADSSLQVAERDAPAIQQLAAIRGDAQRARSLAREAVTASPDRRGALREKKDEAFADIDRLLAEHWSLQLDPAGTRDTLLKSRIGLETPVNAAFDLLAQGDVRGALTLLDQTRPDYERLDHAIQDDIISHSNDTRAVTERVHESLQRFVYQSLGFVLFGMLGALILLRLAIGSLRMLVASMAARQVATEERAAELDAFAARVAHDLRTPLTTMRLSWESQHVTPRGKRCRTSSGRRRASPSSTG